MVNSPVHGKYHPSDGNAEHPDVPPRISLECNSPPITFATGEAWSKVEPSPRKGPRKNSMEGISKLLHNIIRKEKKIGRFTVVVEEYPEDVAAEEDAEKASTSQPANDDADVGEKATSSPAAADEPMSPPVEVASAPRRRFSVVLERTPDFSHPGSRRESQQGLPPLHGGLPRPRAVSISSCSSSSSFSFSSPGRQHSRTPSQQSSASDDDVDCSSLVQELHFIQARLQSVHTDLQQFASRLQLVLESRASP